MVPQALVLFFFLFSFVSIRRPLLFSEPRCLAVHRAPAPGQGGVPSDTSSSLPPQVGNDLLSVGIQIPPFFLPPPRRPDPVPWYPLPFFFLSPFGDSFTLSPPARAALFETRQSNALQERSPFFRRTIPCFVFDVEDSGEGQFGDLDFPLLFFSSRSQTLSRRPPLRRRGGAFCPFLRRRLLQGFTKGEQ